MTEDQLVSGDIPKTGTGSGPAVYMGLYPENDQNYRRLVETLIEGIWAIDAEGRTTFVNPALAKMLGYSIEEMAGRHLFDFMDGEMAPLARENMGRRRSGVAEIHDIIERKQKEESLLEYGTAVEQSADDIALADIELHIRFVNKAWSKMHEYSADEREGIHLIVFSTQERMEKEAISFNQRQIAQGSQRTEIGHARKDGATFPTQMISTVMVREDGSIFPVYMKSVPVNNGHNSRVCRFIMIEHSANRQDKIEKEGHV